MSERKTINVLIVDDHIVVRSGIRAVLMAYDDINLLGEASNGQEAIEMCEKNRPDIVLMDLIMPGVDGIEATATITKKWPDIKVIALTSFKDRYLIEGSLKAGATSYLLKTVSAGEIVTAIRDTYQEKPVLSPEASQVIISELRKPSTREYNLTRREKEILSLIMEGLSNKEIAKRLVVSSSTVKFHVSNILNKLGVCSRTKAVSLAIKQNLVI